jgi:ferredoxin
MSEVITRDGILQLVDEWIAAGKRVAGPSEAGPGAILYKRLASSGALLLDGFLRPRNSIKEFFFPRHEKLYTYRREGKQIGLEGVEVDDRPQLIFAARPCDAAALPILDHVFNWDYTDEFYNRRRANATVVTLACAAHDESCFCTSVGLGPADAKGSDAMLLATGDGAFEIRCFTDKGRAVFEGKTQQASVEPLVPPKPEQKFDLPRITQFVAGGFESSLWQTATLSCLGCGACAYTCPTCHCFDIADEGNAAGGARVKNWDSCQFPFFTLHASGHNPRANQGQRQRQRIYHKFHIYPQKFGEVLCTGCGNCTRNCPVDLGVLGVLTQVDHA